MSPSSRPIDHDLPTLQPESDRVPVGLAAHIHTSTLLELVGQPARIRPLRPARLTHTAAAPEGAAVSGAAPVPRPAIATRGTSGATITSRPRASLTTRRSPADAARGPIADRASRCIADRPGIALAHVESVQ